MNKKIFIVFLLVFFSVSVKAQSYLGYVTTTVNFRSEPNTSCRILGSLQRGNALFIISKDKVNGFYHVLDIETNKEGYVHGNYVQIDKELPENEQGIFTPTGKISEYKPVVKIYNNTDKTLTLKLNDEIYTFSPHQRRSLTLSSGSYSFRASAPGVLPNYGTENIENNYEYEWEFYISTTYR
ncbi:MAG: SH3 domain-containing protein [bacterium]